MSPPAPKLPVLRVDFNEMADRDLVLLSADDVKMDVDGIPISLREGLRIIIVEPDIGSDGQPDELIANGTVEKNTMSGWPSKAKWCCRIDPAGITHRSDTRA